MSKAKYKNSMRSNNLKHKDQQNGQGKVRAMLYYKNLWTIPQVYKSWLGGKASLAKPLG